MACRGPAAEHALKSCWPAAASAAEHALFSHVRPRGRGKSLSTACNTSATSRSESPPRQQRRTLASYAKACHRGFVARRREFSALSLLVLAVRSSTLLIATEPEHFRRRFNAGRTGEVSQPASPVGQLHENLIRAWRRSTWGISLPRESRLAAPLVSSERYPNRGPTA